MQDLLDVLSLSFNLVQQEFTIYGFTFSIWQVIILSCLASIIGYIIRKIFG